MELLRAYQTNTLPPKTRQRVQAHLLTCELCADVAEGMSLSHPAHVRAAVRETRGHLKQLLSQKKRKRRNFQLPIWQTVAVIFVLLFALAFVLFQQFSIPKKKKPQPKPPVTAPALEKAVDLGENTVAVWKWKG